MYLPDKSNTAPTLHKSSIFTLQMSYSPYFAQTSGVFTRQKEHSSYFHICLLYDPYKSNTDHTFTAVLCIYQTKVTQFSPLSEVSWTGVTIPALASPYKYTHDTWEEWYIMSTVNRPCEQVVSRSGFINKGDVGNPILNTKSQTASPIFSACNDSTGVCLQP